MTLNQFFEGLEFYYGERYPDAVRLLMTKYLDRKLGDYLDAAFGALVKHVSRLYGRVPGIAELEKYADEIEGEKPFGELSEGTIDINALYQQFGITGTEAEKRLKLMKLRDQGVVAF
jgi:hypothetical protein